MGAGDNEFDDLSSMVGRVIAQEGYHLLTGGGEGVMAAVARAFTATQGRAGLSLGVVRADGKAHLRVTNPSRSYKARGPNAYVEVPILTHLPHSGKHGKHELSRNHINVLTSHAVVVLPGGDGTASELELALEYNRPVILFIGSETVAGFKADALKQRYSNKPLLVEGEEGLVNVLRNTVGAPCA
jgi:uncharacterized protein (TIGR00725 family)